VAISGSFRGVGLLEKRETDFKNLKTFTSISYCT
jgi:hypothetical protein